MSNTINDNAIMAALGQHLTRAVAKQVVAAGNLANLDTPGYRTRELSFETMLDGEVRKLELVPTTTGQTVGTRLDAPTTAEADGLQSRRDGNNVQLDRELLTMVRASADFAAAETAMAAKFRLIRYAINEGR